MSAPDRFSRQSQLVPTDRLASVTATVIGVGAIGRQVALQLAAVGTPRLQLIDFDHVEESNLTTQGYRQGEVGQPKVAACAAAVHELDSGIAVTTVPDRWRRKQQLGNAVFCCVDSIVTRSRIWSGIGDSIDFWADGRMLGEVIRVLAANEAISSKHYETTLFAQADAQQGTCTSRSTIYAASIAAGLMLHQFSRHLRDIQVDQDICFSLLGGDYAVSLRTQQLADEVQPS